jgi:outer membrane protein assembly factor BamB
MMNRRQFITGAASLMLLTACGRNEPIHQPTPLKSITTKLRVTSVWRESLGSAARLDVPGLRVLEEEGKVFAAASSGQVASLSMQGSSVWKMDTKSTLVAGPVLSPVAELIFVGSTRGEVIALSAKTGEQRWRVALEAEVLSLATGSGRVFVRTSNGRVTSLDISDGHALWVLDHDLPSLSVRGVSAPVLVSNAMLLGWEDGIVEMVLQTNGERVWETRIALPRGRTDIERMVDVQSALLTDGARVYAAATQGKVVSMDLQSGSQSWTNDANTWVDMALGERRVFVIAEDDTIRAYASESGRGLWVQDALKYRRLSKAVAWGKQWMVTFDREGVMHVLDVTSGEMVARVEGAVSGGGIADAFAVTDKQLLVLDVAGNVSLWQAGAIG